MAKRADVALLATGLGIWAAGLVLLGYVYVAERGQLNAALATFGVFLLTGKIPAILAGYALGGEAWLIGLCVLLPDVGTIFVAYPFTHHGLNLAGRFSRFLEHRIANAREKALSQEGFVARRGSLGLLGLTLLPGGLHSPLVVMVVGQLAGFSTRQVLAPILLGQLVMVLAYTVAIYAGLDVASAIDPRIPWIASAALLIVLLLITLRQWLRWRRIHREAPAGPTPPAETAPRADPGPPPEGPSP